MTLNLPLPTEQEIEHQATLMFHNAPELKSSFIQGVWLTIYEMKIKKK